MLNQRSTLAIVRSHRCQVRAQVEKVKSHFIQTSRDNIAKLDNIHRFEYSAERLEFIDFRMVDNKNMFPVEKPVEGGALGPHPTQRESKPDNEWQASSLLLARGNPTDDLLQLCHRANNRSRYADGFYHSMINDNNGHIS
jgi:hypothetical protein